MEIITLACRRFIICFILVILVILGGTNDLEDFPQFILELFLAVLPWGFLVGYYFILYSAERELRNWSIFLKDFKTLLALGDVQVIGATKTALTKETISINTLYIDAQYIHVTGKGYDPKGDFFLGSGVRYKGKGLNHLLRGLVLSSDTWLVKGNIRVGGWFRRDKQIKLPTAFDEEGYHDYDEWSILGSPIEGTFLATGAKGGIWREDLEHQGERVSFLPFNPERRWSAVIYREGNHDFIYINGDPKVILDNCRHIWKHDNWFLFSDWHRKKINAAIDEMAGEGLKIICVAFQHGANIDIAGNTLPQDLILLGLVGIEEWPETGINTIIKGLKSNKIGVNLISGDNYLTVKSFAQTMPVNVQEQWCGLTPEEKGVVVKGWSVQGQRVMALGTKDSDLPLMSNADIAFCYLENENHIKDHAKGLLPKGKLANLLIGIILSRDTKYLIGIMLNISVLLSLIFTTVILAGKYIWEYNLPWWIWAGINCLIIVGAIIFYLAKRRVT